MTFDNDYDRLINDILAQLDGDSDDEYSVIYIDGNDYDIPGLNELLCAEAELIMENEEYADAYYEDGESILIDCTALSSEQLRELRASALAMVNLEAGLRDGKPHYLS